MLHVTNGSIVVSRLHDLGLPGRVLPWDDVLHEGPVLADLDEAAYRRQRAAFLAMLGSESAEEIERHLAFRDDALASARDTGEIVLWFEHDLYDQLQLIEVLDRLPERGAAVTAVLAGDYLGAQPPERLATWFEARVEVSSEQHALAARAWTAFRSTDPLRVVEICRTDPSASAIPHLVPALRRHLQQFPSVTTGLSRSERQTLAAAAGGARRVPDLFRAANHQVEDAVFMGDSVWWWHIRPLLAGPHPLLRVDGRAPGAWNDPAWWGDEESAPRLVLTPDGERVAAGHADHLALNGIDRWFGGVHVTAANPWRYDEIDGTVVRI